jgi:CHASE3 domain sensor protein
MANLPPGRERFMPVSTRRLVQATTAFLFIGLLALMAIVMTNFWLGQRAQSYFDSTIATRDTRVAAVELRSAMQTAEASQRGYLLTQNEIYLAPYSTMRTQTQRQLAKLQVSLVSYPNGQAILDRLTTILTTKFAEFDRTIALENAGRHDEVLKVLRTNSGKSLTDEANVFLSGIISAADVKLTSGVAEQRSNADLLRMVSGIGAVVIIVVIGSAAYIAVHYTKEMHRKQEEITNLNNDLEARVLRVRTH